MAELCGVIGIGQTKYQAARKDVSMAGLVREAALRALEDAGCDWHDIDAVVIGKAPDMFEGVMMPELFLVDALGGAYKPMLRVHTAGSVGGSTGIVAASLVQAGIHERVLCVAYEKQSESNATGWKRNSERNRLSSTSAPDPRRAVRTQVASKTDTVEIRRTGSFDTAALRAGAGPSF